MVTSPPGRTTNLAGYAVAAALGATLLVMLASIVVARSGNLSETTSPILLGKLPWAITSRPG